MLNLAYFLAYVTWDVSNFVLREYIQSGQCRSYFRNETKISVHLKKNQRTAQSIPHTSAF